METYTADMFWLNATNIAMGLLTLLCGVIVIREVLRQLLHRH